MSGLLRLLPFALAAAACACAGPQRPFAVDSPGMVGVAKGRFAMGSDGGEQNERPEHRVFLSAYAIDRTEVSAEAFAGFLNVAGNPGERYFTPDDHATVVLLPDGPAPERRFAPRPGFERHPANNVSWYGADAFCRSVGKRLPTEAEWEKAARGTDRRPYPWGRAVPDGDSARFAQTWRDLGIKVLLPVDALPAGASPYGLLHMSGNVLEWVSDWYRQNLCDFCNPEGEGNIELVRLLAGETPSGPAPPPRRQAPPRSDPHGPSSGSFRVLRGGSWKEVDPNALRVTQRFWLDPAQRFPNTGFRCAAETGRPVEGPAAAAAPLTAPAEPLDSKP